MWAKHFKFEAVSVLTIQGSKGHHGGEKRSIMGFLGFGKVKVMNSACDCFVSIMVHRFCLEINTA